MKVLGLFVLCFGVLSVLPFLWNQFQFVEFGFPFVYLEVLVHESPDYVQQVYDFEILNLVYDLVIVAVAVWAFTKIRPAAKNSI
jgi:hypothetical protein